MDEKKSHNHNNNTIYMFTFSTDDFDHEIVLLQNIWLTKKKQMENIETQV